LVFAKTNSTYEESGLPIPERREFIYGQRANNFGGLPTPVYGTLPVPVSSKGCVKVWELMKQIFDQTCNTIKFSPGTCRIFTSSLEHLMLRICV